MHTIYKVPLLVFLIYLVSVILNKPANADPISVSTYQINNVVCTRMHDGERTVISCEPVEHKES